jgi:hypothetical protein
MHTAHTTHPLSYGRISLVTGNREVLTLILLSPHPATHAEDTYYQHGYYYLQLLPPQSSTQHTLFLHTRNP